jgi:ectoine hydroxylase-related dioxygenase (phytanoyl-CoA dioxygenase family)
MSLARDGYVLVEQLFSAEILDNLKAAFADAVAARSERGGEMFGARNILNIPQVRAIAESPVLPLVDGMRAVRGIFFDKTPAANWPVAWHQDLTLALAMRHDREGWTNWTVKRGVTHVQAPPDVMARMVTMRLHLDDCPEDNGPLRVIPRSHADGILGRAEITARTKSDETIITARAGDALFMCPLLLHASSPANKPAHRRVLHLEFAPPDLLPEDLDWAFPPEMKRPAITRGPFAGMS